MSGSVSNEKLRDIAVEFFFGVDSKLDPNNPLSGKYREAFAEVASSGDNVRLVMGWAFADRQEVAAEIEKEAGDINLVVITVAEAFAEAAIRIVGDEKEVAQLMPAHGRTEDVSTAFDALGAKNLAKLALSK